MNPLLKLFEKSNNNPNSNEKEGSLKLIFFL